jgi:23S rRNA (guanosine2251-2'-O)-methyltransferase
MIVYGRNVAEEYLKKNEKVRKIYLQEGFKDENLISLISKSKIQPKYLPKFELERLANGNHQGIILDIPDYQYKELKTVLNDDPSFVVLLDHLEEPHNLGAINRTSEAAGVDAIVMPKDRQVMINSTVMKTSVGTLDNMDIVAVTNLVQTIEELNSALSVVVKNENVQQNYTYKSVNELLYKNVLLLSFILFAITFVINKLLLREGFY